MNRLRDPLGIQNKIIQMNQRILNPIGHKINLFLQKFDLYFILHFLFQECIQMISHFIYF